MSVTITLVGENIGECIRAVSGVSGSMSTMTTEQLVEELRRRLRPQGLAVNIDPAEEAVATDALDPKINGNAGTVVASPDKPKRGRPRTKKEEPEPEPEPEGTTEQTATSTVEPVTRERVIEALSAYSATHGGQVAARDKMKEVTGKTRLVDIDPADYAKLVARLAV